MGFGNLDFRRPAYLPDAAEERIEQPLQTRIGDLSGRDIDRQPKAPGQHTRRVREVGEDAANQMPRELVYMATLFGNRDKLGG